MQLLHYRCTGWGSPHAVPGRRRNVGPGGERESVAPESVRVQVVLKLELMNRMDGLVDLMGLRQPFRTPFRTTS